MAARSALEAGRAAPVLPDARVQAAPYRQFLIQRFPIPVRHADFSKRLYKPAGPGVVGLSMGARCEALRTSRPHTVQCALRTLLNAWPTSARLHAEEGPRSCVFGCPHAVDMVSHYWSGCRLLHDLVVAAVGDRAPPLAFSRSWGLPDSFSVPVLATLYSFYAEASRCVLRHTPINLIEAAGATRALHFSQ